MNALNVKCNLTNLLMINEEELAATALLLPPATHVNKLLKKIWNL